jgi:hypothetical protein
VRIGFVGVGAQGRSLLGRADTASADVRALCDINPASLERADDLLKQRNRPVARHYVEWRDMLEREDLEAVIIAVPLWAHADVTVGCLDAGKHVLCEKMMAWDVTGCQRMMDAAAKNKRVLEIGYQRNYSAIYPQRERRDVVRGRHGRHAADGHRDRGARHGARNVGNQTRQRRRRVEDRCAGGLRPRSGLGEHARDFAVLRRDSRRHAACLRSGARVSLRAMDARRE